MRLHVLMPIQVMIPKPAVAPMSPSGGDPTGKYMCVVRNNFNEFDERQSRRISQFLDTFSHSFLRSEHATKVTSTQV